MRATDGPGVNVMILLTGYGCLPKSISGGKLRDEFCGRKRARTSEEGGRETKGTKAGTRLVSLRFASSSFQGEGEGGIVDL